MGNNSNELLLITTSFTSKVLWKFAKKLHFSVQNHSLPQGSSTIFSNFLLVVDVTFNKCFYIQTHNFDVFYWIFSAFGIFNRKYLDKMEDKAFAHDTGFDGFCTNFVLTHAVSALRIDQ